MKKKIYLIVEDKDKNLRIDIFINKKETEISRTRIKKLILDKKLKLIKAKKETKKFTLFQYYKKFVEMID